METTSIRKTFGEQLEKLGSKNKNLVILDTDLSNSLYTLNFAKNTPERHFTFSNNENTALSMAAGMAARAKIPFVCGELSQLLDKGLDSLKNSICYPNLNIKVIGYGYGLSNLEEGPNHCNFQDLAILKSLPNLKIFTPADQFELKSMMEWVLQDYGPTFIRISKNNLANIFDQNFQFNPNINRVILPGENLTIISQGHLLDESLKAAEELMKRAVSSQVINLSSLRSQALEQLKDLCQHTELIFVVEDQFAQGGLTGLLQQLFHGSKHKVLGINLENFPESCKYQDALIKNALGQKAIYEKVREHWTMA